MFTLVGYSESQDTAGNLTRLAALADDHIRIVGDDIIVPDLAMIMGVFASGSDITRAQILSPSLRRIVNLEISPINRGSDEPNSPPAAYMIVDNPLPIAKDEALNAEAAEDAAGADLATILVWLADGAPGRATGEIFSVRVTASATLVANAWTNGALTFDQTLPVGRYAIVGARMESTGLIGFRFNFVGGVWRPGGIGVDAAADIMLPGQRQGLWGEWGQFDHNTPPTVDFLSISADTAETGELDLIKLS